MKNKRMNRRGFLGKASLLGLGAFGMMSTNACARTDRDSFVTITEEQKAVLLFMYQEEKVARDVYKTLGEIYTDENTFASIQLSEQRHMDSVETLCLKYGVDITGINEEAVGEFILPELQELYNTLTAQGQGDIISALEVGVQIEITDIEDLEVAKEGMPQDVVNVFDNLIEGSRNHLEAFQTALLRY